MKPSPEESSPDLKIKNPLLDFGLFRSIEETYGLHVVWSMYKYNLADFKNNELKRLLKLPTYESLASLQLTLIGQGFVNLRRGGWSLTFKSQLKAWLYCWCGLRPGLRAT